MSAPVLVLEHRHFITFAPGDSGQLPRLLQLLEQTMDAIEQLRADLAAATQSNQALATALDASVASTTNLVGDIDNLQGQIVTLSDLLANATGVPADVLAQSKAVVEGATLLKAKGEALAAALAAADAKTPPPAAA